MAPCKYHGFYESTCQYCNNLDTPPAQGLNLEAILNSMEKELERLRKEPKGEPAEKAYLLFASDGHDLWQMCGITASKSSADRTASNWNAEKPEGESMHVRVIEFTLGDFVTPSWIDDLGPEPSMGTP